MLQKVDHSGRLFRKFSDSIDHHVEEAVVQVQDANQQLVKAEEHQRAANKKKICLGATIAIIIIIIVIIIVVKST